MREKIDHFNKIYPSVKRDLHCIDLVAEAGKFNLTEPKNTGGVLHSYAVFFYLKNYADGKKCLDENSFGKVNTSTRFLLRSPQKKLHSCDRQKQWNFLCMPFTDKINLSINPLNPIQ